MQSNFSEIVIEGPFVLVKGFLMGYLYGSKKEFRYFFHRKHGIRRETFREFIKELFEFESYVHLCLENNILQEFLGAVENAKDKIGLEVKSIRNINGANFSFSYEIFNKDIGQEIKTIFDNCSSGVKLKDFNTDEQSAKDAEGIEAYAPAHSYIARGSGKAEGNILDVMDLYLSIKKSNASENVVCSSIALDLEEINLKTND